MSGLQAECDRWDSMVGRKGSHYALAKALEEAGFQVDMDPEDNERSVVKLQGVSHPDGTDVVLGYVIGDADAEIVGG